MRYNLVLLIKGSENGEDSSDGSDMECCSEEDSIEDEAENTGSDMSTD